MKLNPCKLCGGQAAHEYLEGKVHEPYVVKCSKCAVHVTHWSSMQAAIKCWNEIMTVDEWLDVPTENGTYWRWDEVNGLYLLDVKIHQEDVLTRRFNVLDNRWYRENPRQYKWLKAAIPALPVQKPKPVPCPLCGTIPTTAQGCKLWTTCCNHDKFFPHRIEIAVYDSEEAAINVWNELVRRDTIGDWTKGFPKKDDGIYWVIGKEPRALDIIRIRNGAWITCLDIIKQRQDVIYHKPVGTPVISIIAGETANPNEKHEVEVL